MTKLCTPISSSTSFPNTPESDRRPSVYHDVDVKLLDGSTETVRLMATDPFDAVEKVRNMPDATFLGLKRIKPE